MLVADCCRHGSSLWIVEDWPRWAFPSDTYYIDSAVFSIAPSYIKDMLTSVADMPGRERLRSATSGSFDFPRGRTCIGSQAFSVAGPQGWNSLPVEMRTAPMTRSVSKNRLKTFLFELAYLAIGRWNKKNLVAHGI